MLLSARIVVDPQGLAERLADHADCVQTDDDAFVWQGAAMSPVLAEPLVAQARVEAAAMGLGLAPHAGPRRITQAHLRPEGGCVLAEVNSHARLERLVGFLDSLGDCPDLVATQTTAAEQLMSPVGRCRVDGTYIAVAQATDPGPAAQKEGFGLGPEAMRAWQRAWVDHPLPSLGGLTPRAAAGDPGARRDLEILLRDIEYRSARGGGADAAIDVSSLRAALAMPPQPAEVTP